MIQHRDAPSAMRVLRVHAGRAEFTIKVTTDSWIAIYVTISDFVGVIDS